MQIKIWERNREISEVNFVFKKKDNHTLFSFIFVLKINNNETKCLNIFNKTVSINECLLKYCIFYVCVSSFRTLRGRPMAIGSATFTLVLVDEGSLIQGPIKEAVNITFKMLITPNQSEPLVQCVMWVEHPIRLVIRALDIKMYSINIFIYVAST